MQSLQKQTHKQLINYTPLLCNRRYFAKYAAPAPGKTFKTDCWPGLENTRTYIRGYVKEWYVNEGWGILIDSTEKDYDHRVQCPYYVHWSNIAGINIKTLDVGAPVAFEVVEEDRDNRYHQNMPRSHMYQETRPRFLSSKRNHDSNKVRAINVHQLNRINWETDYIEINEDTNAQNIAMDVDDLDLLDKRKQYESVSDDVLKSVEYRNEIRRRDMKNGFNTLDKIKRKYGEDIAVDNKSLQEIENDEMEKQKYYQDKEYKVRQYPYGFEEDDIYPQDLTKYPQWFPQTNKK